MFVKGHPRRLPWRPMMFALLFLVVTSSVVRGEEQALQFLHGLRERNYFDYAMYYLDQLSSKTGLPEDLRQIISYERAITLRENAKVLRSPDKQQKLLDQALVYLEQFSRENPDHPKSGDANSDRAEILLQKADVEIAQSKLSSNKSAKSEFQQRGRDYVAKARQVLKLAHDQHEAESKKFPTFIDAQKDPKLHAERDRVDRSLGMAALALAQCTYLEARSFDAASRDAKRLFSQAADEFEKIHTAHNNQVGGLHARLWQGKCLEERGDLAKAGGLYDEVLRKEGTDQSLVNLRSQALLFKLGSLQSPENYQIVVDQAEEWLKKNAADSKSQVGLGIQWEQARAFEGLGDQRDQPKPDQERYWRQARTNAQQISIFASEYKDQSLSMLQRLQTKLGGKERKPDDFESAYAAQRQSFEMAEELRKQMESGAKSETSAEDRGRLRQDWINSLNQASANFELASNFAGRRDTAKRADPQEVTASRLMQASTNYFLGRYYEAAVLAQYVAKTTTGSEDGSALDAAFIALASFVKAYNDNRADPEQKQDEMRLIMKAANMITKRWPDSERANEARIVVGQMFKTAKKPLDAAAWFDKVPSSDAKYPDAQLAAGQAYWSAYGVAVRLPKETRPGVEQLTEWKSAAETRLRTGIEKLSKALPADGEVSVELAVGKISLAEILLSQGKESDAVRLLQDNPQSIVKAVAIDDEAARREFGVKRRPIAKLTYILLLRAYIGMGLDKLNDARAAMKSLEAIAAGDSSADLTDLYVELGRGLKSELERFRNSGETARVKKLTTAFESFLDDMFKKQDGQSFGALSWIGETYFALGEMSPDGEKYYDRAAAAFDRILTRTQADSNFATPDQLLNVKVRLVHFNRLKKDFSAAEQLLKEVIKQRPNDLRAQTEAAGTYQDWGSSGQPAKFVTAITGDRPLGMWGWAGIAIRIQRQRDFIDRPEMVETFLNARYGVSLCRFEFAKTRGADDKKKELNQCVADIISSAGIMKSMPDEQHQKLNQLYRDVLREQGKPVTNLPVVDSTSGGPANEEPNSKPDVKEKITEPVPAVPAPKTAQKSQVAKGFDVFTLIGLTVGVVAAAGIVATVFLGGKKGKTKRKSKVKSPARIQATSNFTGIAFEESEPSEASASPIVTTKPRSRAVKEGVVPNSGSVPATKRPVPRSEAGNSPSAKPRPRPPAPPANE